MCDNCTWLLKPYHYSDDNGIAPGMDPGSMEPGYLHDWKPSLLLMNPSSAPASWSSSGIIVVVFSVVVGGFGVSVGGFLVASFFAYFANFAYIAHSAFSANFAFPM